MHKPPPAVTNVLSKKEQVYCVRQFAVTVTKGPDKGTRAVSKGDELTVGTDEGNDLRLTDTAVSRHHAALCATPRGLHLKDLASTNGTRAGGLVVESAYLESGAEVSLGRSRVAVEVLDDEIAHPLATDDQFGDLIGASPAMRRLFPLLERAAESDATVLVTGETGTGKEIVAESLHRQGGRREKPFVIVDCGALPRQLMESELFGHVRGAFTGADHDRKGAFEAANGGTIFLDEIGELALEIQPVLLRVLESRKFRRVGSDTQQATDVRIVAATNRDLRVEVNEKRFRADLFFRLNVLRVELPPLRDRDGDVRRLARHFWNGFRPGQRIPPELGPMLETRRWPGNVRELRNIVERAALLGVEGEPAPPSEPASFGDAKAEAQREWERSFVTELLSRSAGNMSQAAKSAQMSRSHLRLLMQRHEIVRIDFVPDS